jgi:hypothetical protein
MISFLPEKKKCITSEKTVEENGERKTLGHFSEHNQIVGVHDDVTECMAENNPG